MLIGSLTMSDTLIRRNWHRLSLNPGESEAGLVLQPPPMRSRNWRKGMFLSGRERPTEFTSAAVSMGGMLYLHV